MAIIAQSNIVKKTTLLPRSTHPLFVSRLARFFISRFNTPFLSPLPIHPISHKRGIEGKRFFLPASLWEIALRKTFLGNGRSALIYLPRFLPVIITQRKKGLASLEGSLSCLHPLCRLSTAKHPPPVASPRNNFSHPPSGAASLSTTTYLISALKGRSLWEPPPLAEEEKPIKPDVNTGFLRHSHTNEAEITKQEEGSFPDRDECDEPAAQKKVLGMMGNNRGRRRSIKSEEGRSLSCH